MVGSYRVTKEDIFKSLLLVWKIHEQEEATLSQTLNESQCSQSTYGELVERRLQALQFKNNEESYFWGVSGESFQSDRMSDDEEDGEFRQALCQCAGEDLRKLLNRKRRVGSGWTEVPNRRSLYNQVFPSHERDVISFDTMLRHQNVTEALSYVARIPSRAVFASTSLLNRIIVHGILKASSLPPIRKALQLLSDAVRKHPPRVTSMRDHYLTVFRFQPDGDNKPFDFLKSVIGGCLGEKELFQYLESSSEPPTKKRKAEPRKVPKRRKTDDSDIDVYIDQIEFEDTEKVEEVTDEERCFALLRFLSQLLSEDFLFWVQKKRNPLFDLRRSSSSPMIARIFWSDGIAGPVNANCKILFNYFQQALIRKDLKLIEELSTLISMVGEVSFLSDLDSTEKVHFPKANARAFATSLEIALQELLVDTDDLNFVLLSLKPAWLKMEFLDRCLSNTDDRWKRGMKLKELLTDYWTAFGVHVDIFPRQKSSVCIDRPSSPVVSSSQGSRKPLRTRGQNGEDLPPPLKVDHPESAVTTGKREMRKNSKGESRLHLACQKGDIGVVRDLLRTPCVDPNVRDNAGWTPLHDAAWKGTADCVRLLLNHKVHTLNALWKSPKSTKDGAVDVLAKGPGGRTALHLAAEYGHSHVARLLLKKGGDKLFEAETDAGFTAENLARSPAFPQVFRDYVEERQDDYFTPSQGLSQNLFDSPSQKFCGSPMKIRPSEVRNDEKSREKVRVCVQHYVSAYVNYFRLEIVEANLGVKAELGEVECEDALKLFSEDFEFVSFYQDLRMFRDILSMAL